jgi:hypothetical protein
MLIRLPYRVQDVHASAPIQEEKIRARLEHRCASDQHKRNTFEPVTWIVPILASESADRG